MTKRDLILKAAEPKSDQLNADDLIAGPRTIQITEVKANAVGEQRVAIHYVGDNGKPWKPSKGMQRVLLHAWPDDPDQWAGRHATLFNDPEVTFGKDKTGGIRISHLSHINSQINMALTMKKGQRKPYTVLPIKLAQASPQQDAQQAAPKPQQAGRNTVLAGYAQAIKNASMNGVKAILAAWETVPQEHKAALQDYYNERYVEAQQVDHAARSAPVGFQPYQDTPPPIDDAPPYDEPPAGFDSIEEAFK